MNTSVIERFQRPSHLSPSPVDEEVLDTLARQVKAALSPPVAPSRFDLEDIRKFLDLTRQIAQEASVPEEELEELLDYAAREYVARYMQHRVSRLLQVTFESSEPSARGEFAFFRRFARVDER